MKIDRFRDEDDEYSFLGFLWLIKNNYFFTFNLVSMIDTLLVYRILNGKN